MSDRLIRLLLVEDDPDDAHLVERMLVRGGYELVLTWVQSLDELEKALEKGGFDLAITDHEMGDFDSPDVLRTLAESAPHLPCILVSGKVGEEAVGEAMRLGAADYVSKDNLARLAAVTERTLAAGERHQENAQTEEALARSGRLFEAVFANARDAIVIFDDSHRLIDVNPAGVELLGGSRTELLELKVDDLLVESTRPEFPNFWKDFLMSDQHRGEVTVRCVRGDEILTEYSIGAGFLPGRHILVMRDIRARRQAELDVQRHIAQQEAIAELGELALRGDDLDSLFEMAVARVSTTLGAEVAGVLEVRPDEQEFVIRATVGMGEIPTGARAPYEPPAGTQAAFTVGQPAVVLVDDYDTETRFAQASIFGAKVGGIRSGVSVAIPGHPEPFGVIGGVSKTPGAFSLDDAAFLTAAANLLADAVELHRREKEMRRRALHDPLTGLGNRTLFTDRLTQGLARVSRNGSRLAVISVDLDSFKSMNDTFGHLAGDQLLVEVAERIRRTVREGDTVARFGGDEFVVLYEDIHGEGEAEAFAARLLAALEVPFDFDEGRCAVTASLGIALSDGGHNDAEALLQDADIALYRSKERGRARWAIATKSMRDDVVQRSAMKQDLKLAIGTDQLYLDYQPMVNLEDGGLYAVEALLRWDHPKRGLIPPGVFIPIAEESSLILRLGEWVLREACRQAVIWRKEFDGHAPLPVHVNVSARQIAQADLADTVRAVLDETGASADIIALEITESVLMDGFGAPEETLGELRAMGVRVVLDDFGTGYSSLSYLDRFPIDTLKIDQSFIAPLGEPDVPAPVVGAILGMAGSLELDSVAEGVETADQSKIVSDLGCKYAQGYFYGRPGPPDQIAVLARDDSPLRERMALGVSAAANPARS